MAEFEVSIEATFSRVVPVEAADEASALAKARRMVDEGEIVLDEDDMTGDYEIEIW